MTPTTVPTNTGTGIAATLCPISVLVETDIDLSVPVAFTEVVMCAVSSSSAVVEAISKVRVVSNCKVVAGGKGLEFKTEVYDVDTAKHNTRVKLFLLIGINVILCRNE